MEKYKVTFYPDNKTVEVDKDRTILSAALSAGIYINSSCGGDGVCGRCKVILKSGVVFSQPTGRISQDEKSKGVYLACLTAIQSDCEVQIPEGSRLEMDKLSQQDLELRLKGLYQQAEDIQFIEPGFTDKFSTVSALATKIYLELPASNIEDNASDLERLYRQIHKSRGITINRIGLTTIRQLNELLRAADWKITVTIAERNGVSEIVFVEPGDTSERNYGLVFDIGTTTISGQLVDLNTRNILGTKATYNKQASFGADVITRIIYAQKQEGLEKLHHVVIDCMNEIIRELVTEQNVDLNDVTCIFCSGNTTMIHLLLRIDPKYIRRQPYVPVLNTVPVLRAAEVGIKINPHGLVGCVPGISGYVGGDVTAGILACGLDKKDDLGILIDIGTNGEIALGNKEFLVATSASAGPAFEGSGVSCGMRSSRGAIQKIKITLDLNVTYSCIANCKPRGICGSGYIDLVAEMLKAGILDKNGKIRAISHKRIRKGEFGQEFIVVFKEESESAADIVINEADIENLKRAKAAIYSATSIMVKHMSLDYGMIKNIYVSGGFGTSLDIDNAINIGLLPDLDKNVFSFVGNSSLAGCRQALLSSQAVNTVNEIAKKTAYFELSIEPGYMDEYMAALFFPHTDLAKFPNVRFK